MACCTQGINGNLGDPTESHLKGEKTSNELASQFQIAPAQISTWKRQAVRPGKVI